MFVVAVPRHTKTVRISPCRLARIERVFAHGVLLQVKLVGSTDVSWPARTLVSRRYLQVAGATHQTISVVYPKHNSHTRIHGVYPPHRTLFPKRINVSLPALEKPGPFLAHSTYSPIYPTMFEQIIDEFSFDHPANKGYGKSKKLRQLSSGDPQFSTSKRSHTFDYQHNFTRTQSKGSSVKAGNIQRKRDRRFKEFSRYLHQRQLYHHTSVTGTCQSSI